MQILIVDDNKFNRIVLKKQLSTLCNNILEASDGKEAIESLQQNKDINFIFMDIEMPVMNGIEATKYIRKELSDLNPIIIALTSHNNEDFIQECLVNGMNDYLVKPTTIPTLTKKIENYS